MIPQVKVLSLALITFAIVLALPGPGLAVAEVWGPPSGGNPDLANQLKEFKRTAWDMRGEADTLSSFANQRLSWQIHSNRHLALQEQINRMGSILAELEAQKSLASDTQRMAIEQARPHLVAAADDLTQVIEMVREDRHNVLHPDYEELVQSLSSHANSLYEKLDTILD
jgi:hypothetical protein